jgi:lysyl-tRNA synthetase class II
MVGVDRLVMMLSGGKYPGWILFPLMKPVE